MNLVSAADQTLEEVAANLARAEMKARASFPNPPKVSTIKGTNSAPSACARAAYRLLFSCAASSAARRGPLTSNLDVGQRGWMSYPYVNMKTFWAKDCKYIRASAILPEILTRF